MRALTSIRNAPTRLAVRLQTAGSDAGMSTAEYAVGTVATCGFGGVLVTLLKSETAQNLLKSALTKAFDIIL